MCQSHYSHVSKSIIFGVIRNCLLNTIWKGSITRTNSNLTKLHCFHTLGQCMHSTLQKHEVFYLLTSQIHKFCHNLRYMILAPPISQLVWFMKEIIPKQKELTEYSAWKIKGCYDTNNPKGIPNLSHIKICLHNQELIFSKTKFARFYQS